MQLFMQDTINDACLILAFGECSW